MTERADGGHPVAESDLNHRCETACDPRLNRSQPLDPAFGVADIYRQQQGLANHVAG